MPYARKYQKRKAPRRRPAQEKRIRKVVKSELKKEIEAKYFDYALSSSAASTSVTNYQPLTGFSRGTGSSNYIGSKIKPLYLTLRGTFSAGDATNFVRMIVIQDKAVSGTPTLATMFQNVSYPWISPFQLDYIDSYTVLKDKLFALRTFEGAAGSFSGIPTPFKVKISGKRLRQISYSAGGTADTGQIWVCFVSDSLAVSHPAFNIVSRLTYSDA